MLHLSFLTVFGGFNFFSGLQSKTLYFLAIFLLKIFLSHSKTLFSNKTFFFLSLSLNPGFAPAFTHVLGFSFFKNKSLLFLGLSFAFILLFLFLFYSWSSSCSCSCSHTCSYICLFKTRNLLLLSCSKFLEKIDISLLFSQSCPIINLHQYPPALTNNHQKTAE